MFSAGGQSIRMTSYWWWIGRSALRSLSSRPAMVVSRRTSAAVRSWFEGISDMPGVFSSAMITEAASVSPSNTSPVPRWIWDFSTPQPMVALPCGSMSMSSTRRRVAANEAARFTAVVVLPTPPFWFATAMMRFMVTDINRSAVPVSAYRRGPT